MYYYVYSDELAHHGIKGQRWGIRRWQNPDGTLTEAGKKRYGTAENLKAGKTLKQVQKEKEEKEKLITSGNAVLVKKNASKLTDEEFQRALSRLDKQKKLDDINTGFVENAKKKFESVKGMIDSVAAASTKVVETYNTVANVVNSINPDAKWKKISDKTPSVEDQQKAYNLKKQKEKDQRTAQVEEIFKQHGNDLNWVRAHANEFSKDELESFFARANALGTLNDPNESWRKENRQGNNKDQQKEKTPSQADKRKEEVEKILREHGNDPKWIQSHMSEFSEAELNAFKSRLDTVEKLRSKYTPPVEPESELESRIPAASRWQREIDALDDELDTLNKGHSAAEYRADPSLALREDKKRMEIVRKTNKMHEERYEAAKRFWAYNRDKISKEYLAWRRESGKANNSPEAKAKMFSIIKNVIGSTPLVDEMLSDPVYLGQMPEDLKKVYYDLYKK